MQTHGLCKKLQQASTNSTNSEQNLFLNRVPAKPFKKHFSPPWLNAALARRQKA